MVYVFLIDDIIPSIFERHRHFWGELQVLTKSIQSHILCTCYLEINSKTIPMESAIFSHFLGPIGPHFVENGRKTIQHCLWTSFPFDERFNSINLRFCIKKRLSMSFCACYTQYPAQLYAVLLYRTLVLYFARPWSFSLP